MTSLQMAFGWESSQFFRVMENIPWDHSILLINETTNVYNSVNLTLVHVLLLSVGNNPCAD